MKKWEGVKDLPLNLAWAPRGLNPVLIRILVHISRPSIVQNLKNYKFK